MKRQVWYVIIFFWHFIDYIITALIWKEVGKNMKKYLAYSKQKHNHNIISRSSTYSNNVNIQKKYKRIQKVKKYKRIQKVKK